MMSLATTRPGNVSQKLGNCDMREATKPERPCDAFDEWDVVLVSGKTDDQSGRPFSVTRLRAMAATVYSREWTPPADEPDSAYWFKVWPMDDSDPQLPATHDGKLWFDWRDPETVVEVVERAE